jgi:hypothetical protein
MVIKEGNELMSTTVAEAERVVADLETKRRALIVLVVATFLAIPWWVTLTPPPQMFTFARNALGSNGSFLSRFIASPPFAGLILKRRPFYSIAPRRDNPLAAASRTLARVWMRTFAWVRAVNGIRVIFDESRASGRG